jgi:hypothetical protein
LTKIYYTGYFYKCWIEKKKKSANLSTLCRNSLMLSHLSLICYIIQNICFLLVSKFCYICSIKISYWERVEVPDMCQCRTLKVYLEQYLEHVTPNAGMLADNMLLWSFIKMTRWIWTLGQFRSIINSLLRISIHIVHLITTRFLMILITSMHRENTSKLQTSIV